MEPHTAPRQPQAKPVATVRAAAGSDAEAALQRVELHLGDLQAALSARDMPCIELHSAELHKALQHAIERFAAAARRGGMPLPLRRRLELASAQVAAQRDALARATAALDRAIDVLVPQPTDLLYSQSGLQPPRRSNTALEA